MGCRDLGGLGKKKGTDEVIPVNGTTEMNAWGEKYWIKQYKLILLKETRYLEAYCKAPKNVD